VGPLSFPPWRWSDADAGIPYDEDLANRIRELIADDPDITEKRVHWHSPSASVPRSPESARLRRYLRSQISKIVPKRLVL
jgi:hypothetical protein